MQIKEVKGRVAKIRRYVFMPGFFQEHHDEQKPYVDGGDYYQGQY